MKKLIILLFSFILFGGFTPNNNREFIYENHNGERIYDVYDYQGVQKGFYWSKSKNTQRIKMGIELAYEGCVKFTLQGKIYYFRLGGVMEHEALATKYINEFEEMGQQTCEGRPISVFRLIQIPD